MKLRLWAAFLVFFLAGVFLLQSVFRVGSSGSTPVSYLPAVIFEPSETGRWISFAVIGDYGEAGEREEAVAQMVKAWDPDFIITTGDNNYSDGSPETIDINIGQYYSQYIFPYTGDFASGPAINRFFPSLGNHDWYQGDVQPYLDYFPIDQSPANSGSSANERYYDFVQPPVHFFVLSSDSREPDGVAVSSLQAEWLQRQLAASSSPWKIVYFHHPPYSSGYHGSTEYMRWPFQEWGADAVLSGHEHSYERLLIDDFPYFVNGSGGRGLRDFGQILPGSLVRYGEDHGAMLVRARENSLLFEFYSIRNSSNPIDRYSIVVDDSAD